VKKLYDIAKRVYNPLNKLVRRIKHMKRTLLLAVFVIMLTALISLFATLVNPANWPTAHKLLTALPVWGTVLIALAFIALIWWVTRSTFRGISEIDEKDKENRKRELKEVIREVLAETGLVGKDKVENKRNAKNKDAK